MADTKTTIFTKLLEVQKTAKAPREISGRFGKARSAEQILEAYKPVCNDNGLYLYTTDEMQEIGGRNYVTATATVVDIETGDSHSASASAWENEAGGGLDTSQVTGKTSSYAKKYSLQNLFAIDDTKDADQEHHEPAPRAQSTAEAVMETMTSNEPPMTLPQRGKIALLTKKLNIDPEAAAARMKEITTAKQAAEAIQKLEAMLDEQEKQ